MKYQQILLPSPYPNLHPQKLSSPMFSSPLLSLNVLQLRALISDFSIIISILVFCGLDCLLDLDTPKLHVPTEIKVSSPLSSTFISTRPVYVTT